VGLGSPKTGPARARHAGDRRLVREELRSREPLVDMRMRAIRGVWTTNTVAFLIGVGLYSSFVLLPELVQEPASSGGSGPRLTVGAGLFLLPATIAIVIVGQGRGSSRPHRLARFALIGGALFALACYVLASSPTAASKWEIYVAAGLLGIGIGLSFSAMANLIVENVAPGTDRRGHGDERGYPNARRRVRRQLAATLLASTSEPALPLSSGFTLAFLMCLHRCGRGALACASWCRDAAPTTSRPRWRCCRMPRRGERERAAA